MLDRAEGHLRALVNSRTIPHVDDAAAWSAVCFVVRTGFRRRGLMHDLLDGAVEHARASGATVIEGYPVEPEGDRVDQTSAYVGTVRLFKAHGFQRVLQTTGEAAASRAGLYAASSPEPAQSGVASMWPPHRPLSRLFRDGQSARRRRARPATRREPGPHGAARTQAVRREAGCHAIGQAAGHAESRSGRQEPPVCLLSAI